LTSVGAGRSAAGARRPLPRPPRPSRRREDYSDDTALSASASNNGFGARSRPLSKLEKLAKAREDSANLGTGKAATAPAAVAETVAAGAAKPPHEALLAPPASAAEVAQYERHWAFLLQAELSKSMGDVQVDNICFSKRTN